MVGWYDPAQLFRTGVQTILTEVFATRADFRLLMALAGPQAVLDLSAHDALTIDYVSDTGDGWRPTVTVFEALARPSLRGPSGEEIARGELLILGGDEVYPAGSVAAYESRLVAPMRAASEGREGRAMLLALPGNHDWYDGLVGFVSTFTQKAPLGLWHCFQQRSYHCIKLPHRHWLLAVDLQLQCDIDVPQQQWFESSLKDLGEGDAVIVCLAEPTWVFRQQYRKDHGPHLRALLRWVTEQRRARVVLSLAGDLHHYRRMERRNEGGGHFITAGGGGAFLHPTHTPSVARLTDGREGETRRYQLHHEYPSRAASERLAARNFLFPLTNPQFGLATAGVYTVLSWLLPKPDVAVLSQGVMATLRRGLEQAATQPSAFVVVGSVLAGVVFFTDSNRRSFKVLGGLTHGALHLIAALFASGLGISFSQKMGWVGESHIIAQRFAMLVSSAVFGYLLGGLIMGLYLFVSVRVFRRHANEAFSSLKIEGYKNFLRLKIDEKGLKLWAFAIDAMPALDAAGLPEGAGRRSETEPKVIDTLAIAGPVAAAPGQP